jgi:hypothetical protein
VLVRDRAEYSEEQRLSHYTGHRRQRG